MKVYVATMAWADSPREQGTEILGVFSTEEAALAFARRTGPATGEAMAFILDEPDGGSVA